MEVVILGGQGDGLVAAQVILDMQRSGVDISLLGFLNDYHEVNATIGGYRVLGLTSDWIKLPSNVHFHFSLLSVGKMPERVNLIESLSIPPERLVSLVHPTAQVADDAKIGRGCLITSYAVLQPGSRLGGCCSVRAGANVGHDVVVEDFVYIGPNSTMCGYSKLLKGSYAAPNSVLRDSCVMGEFSVLGAGSVAFKDMPRSTTFIGNPARRVR